ncbi:MAG: hypothetical protein AB7H88_00230 [Vicinamibacterales bacterium]
MSGVSRSLSDFFSFLGGRRSPEPEPTRTAAPSPEDDPTHPTKALAKFLKVLQSCDRPALIDLGPVVGSNVAFFGEQLGCKIRVEDIASEVERHLKAGTLEALPEALAARFPEDAEQVDGVLCWDVLDYLERPAAQALSTALVRLLRPGGVLMGLFSTTDSGDQSYTKYVVVDEQTLRHRPYPASRPRQRSLLIRDVTKLFDGLSVSDSFLMKNNVREMLFRKAE